MVSKEIGEHEHNCPETEEWRKIEDGPFWAREVKITTLDRLVKEFGLEEEPAESECSCLRGIQLVSIAPRISSCLIPPYFFD